MSRDRVLAAVTRHHGDPVALPPGQHAAADAPGSREDLLTRFLSVLEQVGGKWVERTPGDDLDGIIRAHYPGAECIASAVEEPPRSTLAIAADTAPTDLVRVQLAVLRGLFGVAENGAIWVDGDRLPHRALPFVAEHLVLVLAADDVVPDMHAAYARLGGWESGYGVFVSGPSKTADIEQALVIGAQGPRSLLVVLDSRGSFG
ncbi:MAG: LUD domain-containing protein [Gemmatimonadales bacterium]